MSQTYLQLKIKLRGQFWPAGEAKSLRASHDAAFERGMVDLQRWVDQLKKRNISQFPHCSTYWEDAKTVVEAPKGIIRRIYTITEGDTAWRDKVHYWSTTFHLIEGWAKWLYEAVTPENVGLPALPQGFRHAEAAVDSTIGRARVGSWAIYRHRLYVAPWIQSNEILVVEWDGLKTSWADTDVLNTDYWHSGVEQALSYYVLAEHEKFFGDAQEAAKFMRLYEEARADLMYDSREETRQQQVEAIPNARPIRSEELDDDLPVAETSSYKVCVFADSGLAGTPLADVMAAMIARSPDAFIGNGDLTYGGSYEDLIDAYLSDYRTDDQSTNKMFASAGNHDIDVVGFSGFTAFFLGNKGNKRYYSFVIGPMHFFVISTDPREADIGYIDAVTVADSTAAMWEWLRVSLAMSTAKYKFVVGHHAPYTSDVSYTDGNKWLRQDYAGWGATAYIAGHAHNAEYIVVNGFPYFTCGLGGHSIRAFGAATTGVQWQYNANYAFLELTADCDSTVVKLVDRTGAEIHEVEITN